MGLFGIEIVALFGGFEYGHGEGVLWGIDA
jgi:hypothetical protein